jgi:cell division protein FtsL
MGYKSENLRTERKRLTEENQRLSLEKEKITAPAKLDPAARQLGLLPATARQIAVPESSQQKQEVSEVENKATEQKATR